MTFFAKVSSFWRPVFSTGLRYHGVGCYSSLARRSNLMAQFTKVKKQYQDYILLFQVGDFYEMYGEDASKYKLLKADEVLFRRSPIAKIDFHCHMIYSSSHGFLKFACGLFNSMHTFFSSTK